MAIVLRNDIPHGTARGNTCYLCGSAQRELNNGEREAILDTGITIDFEGYLMFCSACAVEMGTLVGMLAQPKAAALIEVLEQTKEKLATTEAELAIATAAVEGLKAFNTSRSEKVAS